MSNIFTVRESSFPLSIAKSILQTFRSCIGHLVSAVAVPLCTIALFLGVESGVAYSQGDSPAKAAPTEKKKPIRALLIAGGCCHDYAKQQEAICKGIQSRANVQVDVYWTDNSTTSPVLPLYLNLNWADEYDIIIHDECAADIKDEAIINRIVQVHQKLPAVHLHCAMHSFRLGNDVWFEHLGLQSSGHGPQEPIDIQFTDTKHPIVETLGDWTTVKEELYNNVKLFGAHPIASGKQVVKRNGESVVEEAVVAWVNEKSGAKSFSTTIGHNTETVQDDRYLDLITRGLLWACDKLTPEYLVPYEGENVVTFIDKTKFSSGGSNDVGKAPENATLVKVTASSTQSGNANHHVVDGKKDTRWCADGPNFPSWVQLEFPKPISLSGIEIDWESPGNTYRYLVEGSSDGKTWETLIDRKSNSDKSVGKESISSKPNVKYLRVTGLGASAGWCSIWEIRIDSKDVQRLWPASTKDEGFVPLTSNAYEKSGNEPPRIEKLTKEEEQEILRDVKVADGFEATVFAAPPAVNYPVFVASTVDGTVFVSSDGNGSLGRDPMRGRVVRLRDLDQDGRADEVKVFCHVDAPRGLVWDGDRLYLMHPPHLSAFIDHDGDGVADEQKVLVKNLAFGYDKRPADHTTNGVSLGLDGWLYIAGGDFGFLNAEGSDGRKLTHRGGGVIRVRPDGTGLEVYSTGTRNILEVAISPEMELFARDNTNDGDGWDVRMHHFTGGDDHGYPRLYKNFADECVPPLADYGGGSGCGAVYVDEPGFGTWNHSPFTADWGTGALYRHTVSPSGATYQETEAPKPFVQMTRPTDADVDGNSNLYCASWRGATFSWAGPDVGYLVRVKPKGFNPEKQINFAKATTEELVKELQSNSYRRRLEATRTLARRGDSQANQLIGEVAKRRTDLRNLIEDLQSSGDKSVLMAALSNEDALVVHTAVREIANRGMVEECLQTLNQQKQPSFGLIKALAMMHDSRVVDSLLARSKLEKDDESQRRLLWGLCRLVHREAEWNGDSWGTRPDHRGPYYQPVQWSESEKIVGYLNSVFASANPELSAYLVELMSKNRIAADQGLAMMIKSSRNDPKLLASTLAQLAITAIDDPDAMGLLDFASQRDDLSLRSLGDAVQALSRSKDASALVPLLRSVSKWLAKLSQQQGVNDAKVTVDEKWVAAVRASFVKSGVLGAQIHQLVSLAEDKSSPLHDVAIVGVLAVASNASSSPETAALARKAISGAWTDKSSQVAWMENTVSWNLRGLDEEILEALSDADESVRSAAERAAKRLRLKPREKDLTPRISSMTAEQALERIKDVAGDVSLGQRIFAKATCGNCHTVQQNETQKGPYLGNIAKTYKRPELATAILEPSRTIAQGFITNIILTEDDETVTGFVISETAEEVTIRDQQGKDHVVKKSEIATRKTSTISSMPNGMMNDFTLKEMASLLDYLESLSK
ncbi:MAG: discoidin domain-containing protein [Pirellula sp.]|jgi:putative heme-binding domain-containing protein